MPNALSRLLQKWFYGFLELLLYFPAILATGVLLFRHTNPWLWLISLPIVYLAAIVCFSVLKFRRYVIQLLLATVLGAGASILLFGDEFARWHLASWIVFALYIVFWFRGLVSAQTGWERPFAENHYWIGMSLYFVAYFFYRYTALLHHYMPLYTWAGILAIIVVFFFVNYVHLQNVSLSSQQAPELSRAMIRHNRWFTIVVVLIVFVIAALKQLFHLFSLVMHTIFGVIVYLVSLLDFVRKGSYSPDKDPMGKTQGLPPGSTSPFWLLLEKLAIYAAYIIIGGLLTVIGAFLVFKLSVLALRGLTTFMTWLRQNREAASGVGYRDEKEVLMRLGDLSANYLNRLKEWIASILEKEPGWEDLRTTREKARYLYRHWLLQNMRKGYPFKSYLTPGETGNDLQSWGKTGDFPADEAVALYNEARYADREVDGDALERIHSQLTARQQEGPRSR